MNILKWFKDKIFNRYRIIRITSGKNHAIMYDRKNKIIVRKPYYTLVN